MWQLRALSTLYDGGIYQVDCEIKRIIKTLRERAAYNNTLIVVTSDHGEGFGEQSVLEPKLRLIDHSWGIGEELTHVPLIAKYPSQVQGDSISEPASLTRFRSVTNSVMNGKKQGFDTGDTLSSTFRLHPTEVRQSDQNELKEFAVGPWRAVYTTNSDSVIKYTSVGNEYENTATVEIPNAQTNWKIEGYDNGVVRSIYNELEQVEDLAQGINSIDSDVKVRLSDLGYV